MTAFRLKRLVPHLVPGFAVLALLAATPAGAQSPDPKAGKPPATKSAAPAAPATGTGEGGLKARVDSLEEQLVDMQVVVGTLESLAKSGASSSSQAYRATPAGGGGVEAPRVEALENQVRTLSSQVQQLQDQVRGLGGTPRRSETAPSPAPPVASVQSGGNFGSTTVTPGGDDIGGLIGDGQPRPSSQGAAPSAVPPPPAVASTTPSGASVQTAALPPPSDGSDPKQLYQTAYAYLLQKDYGAAEVAFDDFLKRFPSDALAGNAQYWLGESHFVRGQYKAAAAAFLKGYQSYAEGAKAPDSLLKLAMSLDRLGQKDAACSSYGELSTKFPNAPANVKSRAQSERQRVGCP